MRAYLLAVAALVSVTTLVSAQSAATTWPIPYERRASRPPLDPFCQAEFKFCPASAPMPKMNATDRVEVWLLKAPVWEFKFGDLLGKFNVFHDAIGFNNLDTGRNYTMEWYELFQLPNCTFAHVIPGDPVPKWCNQGGACFYNGIDDKHWAQNGTLRQVTEITGAMFNQLSEWVASDNNTGVYYETWTVREQKEGGALYFESYDCADFVVRAFTEMYHLGAHFDPSYEPKFDRITLYTQPPVQVTDGLNATAVDPALMADIRAFYANFQAHQTLWHALESMFKVIVGDVLLEHKFYILYNQKYYRLALHAPYLRMNYEPVPLPGTPGWYAAGGQPRRLA